MANNLFDNMGLSDMSYLLDPQSQEQTVDSEKMIDQVSKPDETTVALSSLVPFKNHPFHVDTDSEEFINLVDSIRENGVIYPILIRPMGEKYEIIAGHCRATAAEKAGLTEIPAVIKVMDDYEATVIMVHTNIYGRDKIRISEKAKAYRMCMDAEKHQGKKGVDTATMIGNGQDSKRQVYRFVRLSYLSDDFLEFIDTGKLPVSTGLEIAYMDKDSQTALGEYIDTVNKLPSTEQASKLRKLYEDTSESLTFERIVAELTEKPKVKAPTKLTFKTKDIESYFDQGTDAEQMENVILMLLSKYHNGDFDNMLD